MPAIERETVELANANVVITGGSGGIGECLADAFASAGTNVLVVARSADKLNAIASRIGGKALTADLSTEAGVDGLIERCIEALGSIDVWVNNAGVETVDAFVGVARDDVRQLARINFEAPLMLTRDVVPHMLANGRGHVVQMSSVAGAMPFPSLAAYAGSKAGLTNFTETLRIELKDTPIGLTVVSPGPVDTPMWDRLAADATYAGPALKRFKRLGFLPKVTPEAVASKTVKAVAGDARFVRLPARYNGYHLLNNGPRRLVEWALAGVKLALPDST